MGSSTFGTSGAGGRIIPGVGGAAGNGIIGDAAEPNFIPSPGGSGGNAAIDVVIDGYGTSANAQFGAGGGGGWGARGGYGAAWAPYIDPPQGNSQVTLYAGVGGKAVELNGYTVTWGGNFATEFSTRVLGDVS